MTTKVKNRIARIALKPIMVYKDMLVSLDTGKIMSLFRYHEYRLGEVHQVKLPPVKLTSKARRVQDNAIHSYADDGKDAGRLTWHGLYNGFTGHWMRDRGLVLVTHECAIPVGALYYKGSWGDAFTGDIDAYVSNQIIIGREVARMNP